MSCVKVIELVGISDKSWDDAVNEALNEAAESLRGITGIDVVRQKAVVRDNKIVEYRANVKVAFKVK